MDFFNLGVISKFVKSSDGGKNLSLIQFDAQANDIWLESFGKIMNNITKPWLDNFSFLEFPKRVQFIYETDNLTNSSMNLIAHCNLIYFDKKQINSDHYMNIGIQQLKNKGIPLDCESIIETKLP